MTELQEMVADFVDEHHLDTDVTHRLLDLMSEVGELAKEALKASAYGARPFEPTVAWSEELGDVLFSLICVANASGTDIEDSLKRVIEKYRNRLSSRGDAGSGR